MPIGRLKRCVKVEFARKAIIALLVFSHKFFAALIVFPNKFLAALKDIKDKFLAALTKIKNNALTSAARPFNWKLLQVARAVRVGPLIVGRATDLDALIRGASLNPGSQNQNESIRNQPILQYGSIAIMRGADLDNVVDRLKDFNTAFRKARTVVPGRCTGYGRERDLGRRSVLFIHNCYYNFFYLAAALRRRGWDAVAASIEDPIGPHAQFYHGEDVNLFDPDPERYRRNLSPFFAGRNQFPMMYFYGVD